MHWILCSDIGAAFFQVFFSAVYHLKSAVLPYASELVKVSLKSLTNASDKEKVAGAKLMASLMASEEAILESIAGGLLDARTILSSISLSDTLPEVQQEKVAGAKLMASLMASEEAILESIAGGLLDARTILSSISSSDTSPKYNKCADSWLPA